MHEDRQYSLVGREASENTMTTNRPFFGGFLAAFRAQPTVQKAGASQAAAAGSYTHAATAAQAQSYDASIATRTITTKTRSPSPGATTTTVVHTTGQFQPTRQHATPYHRSTSPVHAKAFPIPGASQRNRRGSDSSSDGFNEIMGAEKWYIGGRTATGEEKFYKLGMVKRHRSADRLSLDKLSI
ncbi:hypothetical protein SVAN01_03872 [Stagonosporopsis vannaccii]|nr:hypothetical protein SVAN01_03872 [Stagonosporopsis vannaccii]